MGAMLSSPNTQIDQETGTFVDNYTGNAIMEYICASMQGWRITMEDSHVCFNDRENGISFFGVFDGHGGRSVALYCGKNIVRIFQSLESYKKKDWEKAMYELFFKVDEELCTEEAMKELDELKSDNEYRCKDNGYNRPMMVGCTAVCALITSDKIYVANAGDSRCVICVSGKALPLSEDHKPTLPGEQNRIINAGGEVIMGRVDGNLNLSRSLGDFDYKIDTQLPPQKQKITAEPDITVHVRSPQDEFLILACDGIWDCKTNEEAVKKIRDSLIEFQDLNSIAKAMLFECCADDKSKSAFGFDNLTLIILRFLSNKIEIINSPINNLPLLQTITENIPPIKYNDDEVMSEL